MRLPRLHDGSILHRQEPRSMTRIPFPELPFTVKMAIGSVFSAWGFYVASHALYHGALSLFQVTMGMLCCVLAYSLKNGAGLPASGTLFCLSEPSCSPCTII